MYLDCCVATASYRIQAFYKTQKWFDIATTSTGSMNDFLICASDKCMIRHRDDFFQIACANDSNSQHVCFRTSLADMPSSMPHGKITMFDLKTMMYVDSIVHTTNVPYPISCSAAKATSPFALRFTPSFSLHGVIRLQTSNTSTRLTPLVPCTFKNETNVATTKQHAVSIDDITRRWIRAENDEAFFYDWSRFESCHTPWFTWLRRLARWSQNTMDTYVAATQPMSHALTVQRHEWAKQWAVPPVPLCTYDTVTGSYTLAYILFQLDVQSDVLCTAASSWTDDEIVAYTQMKPFPLYFKKD